MSFEKVISAEDYVEPTCPFCAPGEQKENVIPTDRVISALDKYLDKNDYDGALSHLLYWQKEAEALSDDRGLFSVCNELCGLYRKTGKKEQAYKEVERTLSLIEKLDAKGSVTEATALVNAATVYKAFGEAQRGLPLFDRALELYQKLLDKNDGLFGGLYNNKGLSLCDLGQYMQARDCFMKAIEIMGKNRYGQSEQAISYLNMADTYYRESGEQAEKKVNDCVERAWELLNDESVPHNGYYAFVAEKCAPTFGFYGFFAYENELKERAEKIYAGN